MKNTKTKAVTTAANIGTLAESKAAFFETYKMGVHAIRKAATIYAQAVDKWPEADIEYSNTFPWLTDKEWQLLLRIGHNELTPRAFLIPNQMAIDAVSVFPIKIQEVLVGTEDNPPTPQKVLSRGKVIEKRIEEMSAIEVNALIDKKAARVRTVEEQITAAAEKTPKAESPAWAIRGDILCVYRRANFTIAEISEILRKMKGAK